MDTTNHLLIQTALLALQQKGSVEFNCKQEGVEHTGFYVSVVHDNCPQESSFKILIYLTVKSFTGFAIKVTADFLVIPELPILEKNIDSFEDFEELTQVNYGKTAFEKVRLYRTTGKMT